MIVLTGATGFLGSALLSQLLARGEEVVAIKRSTSRLDKIEALLGHHGLHLIDIDIDDPVALFDLYEVDTIIHTATEYGRDAGQLHRVLDANLVLPLRLAELAMQRGAQCFINTDSFFNKGSSSYSGLLYYSLAKKSLLTWLERLSGQLGIINVVLEHLYGPGDSGSKFVEHVIRQVGVEQVPHIALTHGQQRRDFIYVDDVVQAYLKLVDYGRRSHESRFENFELGTGQSTPVRDFVEQIKTSAGSETILGFGEIPYRSDEIMSSCADISRLQYLGWNPTVSIEVGIERILKQYGREVPSRHRALPVTCRV